MFRGLTLLLVVASTVCPTTLAMSQHLARAVYPRTHVFNAQANPRPCDSAPCKNGGTCTNKGNLFLCQCPNDYKGETCEVPCIESPCKNGGIVLVINGSLKCKCPANYTGVTCEDKHPCFPSPCKNGGTCHKNGECFSCKCPVNFKGIICEEPVQACDSSPCKNGGTCYNVKKTFVCRCPKNFTGPTCEEPCDIIEPCKNGGTLIVTANSLSCNCTREFTGLTCEVRKPQPCDSAPCKNGGTCTNVGSSFSCNCTKDYQGATCQDAVCVGTKMDLLYIVDGSGSVGKGNFKTVKGFIEELNKKFDIGLSKIRMALMQLGSHGWTRMEFGLGDKNTLDEVNKGVENMVYLKSGTDTGDALQRARTQVFNGRGGDRANASDVLILFTDGEANDGNLQLHEAKKLKGNNVKIVTVAMGKQATISQFEPQLIEMASKDDKGNPLYFKADFNQLDLISNAIIEAACSG